MFLIEWFWVLWVTSTCSLKVMKGLFPFQAVPVAFDSLRRPNRTIFIVPVWREVRFANLDTRKSNANTSQFQWIFGCPAIHLGYSRENLKLIKVEPMIESMTVCCHDDIGQNQFHMQKFYVRRGKKFDPHDRWILEKKLENFFLSQVVSSFSSRKSSSFFSSFFSRNFSRIFVVLKPRASVRIIEGLGKMNIITGILMKNRIFLTRLDICSLDIIVTRSSYSIIIFNSFWVITNFNTQ